MMQSPMNRLLRGYGRTSETGPAPAVGSGQGQCGDKEQREHDAPEHHDGRNEWDRLQDQTQQHDRKCNAAEEAKTTKATAPVTTCEVIPSCRDTKDGAREVKNPNMANPTKAIMAA